MSKTKKPGRRARADLDLFLLALIEAGVPTPYDLKIRAGVSPGASIPCLTRLLKGGLVSQGPTQARGRGEYTVTRAGRKYLGEGSIKLLEGSGTVELEVVLRTVASAILTGHSRSSVASFLTDVAALHGRAGIGKESRRPVLADPIGLYREMKDVVDSKRFKSDALALKQIVKLLKKRR